MWVFLETLMHYKPTQPMHTRIAAAYVLLHYCAVAFACGAVVWMWRVAVHA